MISANQVSFKQQADALCVELSGNWSLDNGLVSGDLVQREIESTTVRVARISFNTQSLAGWDSALLSFVTALAKLCREQSIEFDNSGLPEGLRNLVGLAAAEAGGRNDDEPAGEADLLTRVGTVTVERTEAALTLLSFIGETTAGTLNLLGGRARFRTRDLWLLIQQTGAEALPIVTIISFLIGWILAFIGAVQLTQFGASIYVANLVALAMAVEMGAMMTAIIMAGRTGAAYAAELGTMTVNEEIDALRTTGLSPVEFLVIPRMLALSLMMPLLALYADFVGILGGAFVGVTMLDLSFTQYLEQTRDAVAPKHFIQGLIKGSVYGVLVGMSGCYWGMRCGRSAAAVGTAVTSAVVSGIISIIVASAILTVIYQVLGV